MNFVRSEFFIIINIVTHSGPFGRATCHMYLQKETEFGHIVLLLSSTSTIIIITFTIMVNIIL